MTLDPIQRAIFEGDIARLQGYESGMRAAIMVIIAISRHHDRAWRESLTGVSSYAILRVLRECATGASDAVEKKQREIDERNGERRKP